MKYSVIIPIYKSEKNIPDLLKALQEMNCQLNGHMEAVFVVDGSPDQSYELLKTAIEHLEFPAKLIAHSRNFGAFSAIRTGLRAARGKYFSVMAADLQEPPELLISIFSCLANNECDVAIGTRNSRKDPFVSRLTSNLFWAIYKRMVVRDMPKGGVDIFGCNQVFRDQLLNLEESRSSLIALIFWLGFRRKLVNYERQERKIGKSSWTFRKKMDYMMDSIFAFTDYPIRLLTRLGAIGTLISFLGGLFIFIMRLTDMITVPGYAAIILTAFFLAHLTY